MSASAAVTASWSLAQTTTDVLGVSRGILEAATTDNVQPLALLAAEAFGATLPMSIESKSKVEKLCSQDHTSTTLKFLKAKIGYRRGDSGWQLARSDAGLRFLGLAACLMTTERWQSAEMLRALVTETAEDRKLVPTSSQLKALLNVLEYRLARAGFADNVLGWSAWLDQALEIPHTTFLTMIGQPSTATIAVLIQNISSLARLGQDTKRRQFLRVEIVHEQAAWVIAFLKWCLGIPPTIARKDGTILLSQPEYQAYVCPLVYSDEYEVNVSIWDEVGSIKHLVKETAYFQSCLGMISVRQFAEKLLQCTGPPDSVEKRNALDILPYACFEVIDRFEFYDGAEKAKERVTSMTKGAFAENAKVRIALGRVCPSQQTVALALTHFLGADIQVMHKEPPCRLDGSRMPTIRSIIEHLRPICFCPECGFECAEPLELCKRSLWMEALSDCITAVVLLSFVVPSDPASVLVSYDFLRTISSSRIRTAVEAYLDNGRPLRCTMENLVEGFGQLLGHESTLTALDSFVASSHGGQTLYPMILGDLNLAPTGLFTLMCVPGCLTWNGEVFNLVRAPMYKLEMEEAHYSQFPFKDEELSPLLRNEEQGHAASSAKLVPENGFPRARLSWRVSTAEEWLNLLVTLEGSPEAAQFEPLRCITAAARSVFVNCAHDHQRALQRTYGLHITIASLPQRVELSDAMRALECNELTITRTDGNNAMRYFYLCSGRPYVIRERACLDCCVTIARILGYDCVLC